MSSKIVFKTLVLGLFVFCVACNTDNQTVQMPEHSSGLQSKPLTVLNHGFAVGNVLIVRAEIEEYKLISSREPAYGTNSDGTNWIFTGSFTYEMQLKNYEILYGPDLKYEKVRTTISYRPIRTPFKPIYLALDITDPNLVTVIERAESRGALCAQGFVLRSSGPVSDEAAEAINRDAQICIDE